MSDFDDLRSGGASRARRTGAVVTVALSLGLSSYAWAEDDSSTHPQPSGWTFSIAPYLWAAGLDGHAKVAGRKVDVDESFGDILEDLNIAGMILAEARHQRFGIAVNGFFVRTKSNDRVGPLDLGSTQDSAAIAAAAYYRVAEWTLGTASDGRPLTIGIEPLLGARLTYIRAQLRANALGITREADRNEIWVDPIGGVQIPIDLSEHWGLRLEGDIGGFGVGSDISWNVQGILGYRSQIAGLKTVVGVGYRAIHWDYNNGGFEWNVTQQGPILGAAIQF